MSTFVTTAVLLQIFYFTVSFCKNQEDLTLDLSHDCQKNYSTSVHLPFGAGITDARVLTLRSISTLERSCSILVSGPPFHQCQDKCMTVFVIELFSYEAFSAMNGGLTFNSDRGKIETIGAFDSGKIPQYQLTTYLVFNETTVIDINFTNFSGTIKITATSARSVSDYGNCTSTEVYCIFDGHVFCINKLLECDGNLNCGTPNRYDEYYCHYNYDPDNLLFSIIYGTFLIAVLLFFFVQLLRLYIPTVAKHFFVFTEDQDYNFVLTSQMLPPIKIYKDSDESETERIARSTEIHVY